MLRRRLPARTARLTVMKSASALPPEEVAPGAGESPAAALFVELEDLEMQVKSKFDEVVKVSARLCSHGTMVSSQGD